MDARLDYQTSPTARRVLTVMTLGRTLQEMPVPQATQELVALRVGQVN